MRKEDAKTGESVFWKMGFRKKDKFLLQRSLLFTVLTGLCAHGFGILNLHVCHDALFDFYDGIAAHQHQIGLGRVLEPLYREMTASGLLMPWSVGLTAFVWIGLAVFLVCKLLELTSRAQCFLTAGIMTVNLSVTAVTASYTPWLSADMFAMFLAVVSVGCWYGYTRKRSWKLLVLGGLAVLVSLSIYQCYIAVTVVLVILLSIKNLLEHSKASKVFQDGMASLGMLLSGGIVYYLFTKVMCSFMDTPLAEGYYDSVTNLWDNREPVWLRLRYCIKEEMTHFFSKDENIYPYPVIWAVNGILFALCLYLVVCLIKKYRSLGKGEWLLLILLVTALPFAANLMRLLNTDVHDLMVYAVWLLYLVPLLLLKWTAKEKPFTGLCGLVLFFLSFIVFANIQTDNAVYVKKEVESKATLSLMTEIMAEGEQTEGYEPGKTGITFVGQLSNLLQEVPGTERIKGISGCNKSSAITYEETYQAYFDYVMLRDVKVVFDGQIRGAQEVQRMPSYPQKGYVQRVEDVVVIKLE